MEDDKAGAEGGGSWTDGMSDEQRGFVETKGYKDSGALVDAYQHLVKFMGGDRDQLVVWPKEGEDMGKIHERMGRPKEAKEYDLTGLKGVEEEEAAFLKEQAFNAGLSQSAAEKLFSSIRERGEQVKEAAATKQKAEYDAGIARQEEELKTKWGGDYDGRVALVKEASQKLGMTQEAVDAIEDSMGFAAGMEFLYSLAKKMGESVFVDGKGAPNVSSPQSAKAKLEMLKRDPSFAKKLTTGDTEAMQEWNSLHQKAFSA